MKIVVEANWDDEAKVWVAAATSDVGLVTEAETIEELRQKLAVMASDSLTEEPSSPKTL